MRNCYNLDGIKTELQKEISVKKSLLEAWENVTFPTKKDGTPFKIMSKNIEGGTYFKEDYMISEYHYKLRVGCWDNHAGYINDEIWVYEYVEDLKEDTKKNKIENHKPKAPMCKQIYLYDIEDIKKAVNDRIEYLKEYIIELECQLTNADQVYNNFKMLYGNAVDHLKGDTEKYKHSNLYNMVFYTIKDRYPYC